MKTTTLGRFYPKKKHSKIGLTFFQKISGILLVWKKKCISTNSRLSIRIWFGSIEVTKGAPIKIDCWFFTPFKMIIRWSHVNGEINLLGKMVAFQTLSSPPSFPMTRRELLSWSPKTRWISQRKARCFHCRKRREQLGKRLEHLWRLGVSVHGVSYTYATYALGWKSSFDENDWNS